MTVRKTGDSWHQVLPVRISSVTNSSSSWARADRATLSPSIARFGSHTEISRQRSMRRSTLQPGKLSGMYEKADAGLAVLTQTCDLIPRPGRNRPFVAVAPLVELEEQEALEARRGRRPRYAHLPSYEDGRFCVDLDRITTIETGVLLRYARTPGLSTDRDRATFGKAVARKFGRFPFPDDLPRALAKWRDHVVSKHDKENSPEGTLYRHALDVRVSVHP